MRQIGLIERGWLGYAEHVLPKNAPPVQRRETRLAFYAGALHLFDGLLSNLGPGEDADPPDLALMDGVSAELHQYVEDVTRGPK